MSIFARLQGTKGVLTFGVAHPSAIGLGAFPIAHFLVRVSLGLCFHVGPMPLDRNCRRRAGATPRLEARRHKRRWRNSQEWMRCVSRLGSDELAMFGVLF